jgi:hypothetical protein
MVISGLLEENDDVESKQANYMQSHMRRRMRRSLQKGFVIPALFYDTIKVTNIHTFRRI